MVKIQKSKLPEGCIIQTPQDYRSGTVLDLLVKDGKNKCYICEDKMPTCINVEHIIPTSKKGGRFEWENLLLACAHCNGTKGSKYDPIINCTNRDPEEIFDFIMGEFPRSDVKINVRVGEENEEVSNTIKLLLAVYNNAPGEMRLKECEFLRKRLYSDYLNFLKLVDKYDSAGEEGQRETLRFWIRMELVKSSAFSAFKRYFMRRCIDRYPEFRECLEA